MTTPNRPARELEGSRRSPRSKRVRVDYDGPPAVPAGVVVHIGPGEGAFRRPAHDVSTRAFVAHSGFVERSFEERHQGIAAATTTSDWSQVRVA